jgi:hypothetical protein
VGFPSSGGDFAFSHSAQTKRIDTLTSCQNTGGFAQEVWMTAYALKGVEASVSHMTDFECEDFRKIIQSLADASTTVKKCICTMEHGKFEIVGFVPLEDTDFYGLRSPLPSQEKRGQKWKEREDESLVH